MNTTVMFDSPDAAQRVTVTGWVSRNGRFYGEDERLARYDGCTHRACEKCGQPSEKSWLVCKPCRDKQDLERFNAMPEREWDGKAMLYSDVEDRFYPSPEDIEGDKSELRLLLCKPQFASISLDHFCDILPEDGDCAELEAAIETFNETVKDVVISWMPTEVRLKL